MFSLLATVVTVLVLGAVVLWRAASALVRSMARSSTTTGRAAARTRESRPA